MSTFLATIWENSQNFTVHNRVKRMKEPMRTRVQFYIERRLKSSGSQVVTPDDMNMSIGQAFQDKMDDEAVTFDIQKMQVRVRQAQTGECVRKLQESVDDVSCGNSR